MKIQKIMVFATGLMTVSGLNAFPGEDLARRAADEIIRYAVKNEMSIRKLSDIALGMKYSSAVLAFIAVLYTLKAIIPYAKEDAIKQRGIQIVFGLLLTAGTLLGYKTADLLLKDTENPINSTITATRLGFKGLTKS